jgi:hypothetical protein
MPLEACPFCREMFETGEARECPTCGLGLDPIHKLRPSPTLHEVIDEWDKDLGPTHDRLPWHYLARGRGLLVLFSLIGLGLFMLPWVHESVPYATDFSGWQLSHRLGWSWAALVAWVVLVPTVASRRSIVQLRGARVAAPFLGAIPGLTAAILLAIPPPKPAYFSVTYDYLWPIYATLALSALAILVGVRLGGRVDVLVAKTGDSVGQTLH